MKHLKFRITDAFLFSFLHSIVYLRQRERGRECFPIEAHVFIIIAFDYIGAFFFMPIDDIKICLESYIAYGI